MQDDKGKTTKIQLENTQICKWSTAPEMPPAKKTNPDGRDAAANSVLACPRPAGYLVQLLLVALYMSTYDEVSVLSMSASCESEQNRPFTLMQLFKQQVGYKSTRCKCGRRACVMQHL